MCLWLWLCCTCVFVSPLCLVSSAAVHTSLDVLLALSCLRWLLIWRTLSSRGWMMRSLEWMMRWTELWTDGVTCCSWAGASWRKLKTHLLAEWSPRVWMSSSLSQRRRWPTIYLCHPRCVRTCGTDSYRLWPDRETHFLPEIIMK